MKKNEEMVGDYHGILICNNGNTCISLDSIEFYSIEKSSANDQYYIEIKIKNNADPIVLKFDNLQWAQNFLHEIASIHSEWNKRKLQMNNHGAYR